MHPLKIRESNGLDGTGSIRSYRLRQWIVDADGTFVLIFAVLESALW